MLLDTAQEIFDNYLTWLRDNTRATDFHDGSKEITVPFLDATNDHLRYYIESRDSKIIITDIGLTTNELELAGCRLTKNRMEQIKSLAYSFGVKLDKNGELYTQVNSPSELQTKQHAFIQAMLHVSDMFLTIQHKVANYFAEDVEEYFTSNDIRFVSDASKVGRSGLTQMIKFIIPKSKNAPERLVQLLNSPRQDRINATLFSLQDVREGLKYQIKPYIFLNDEKNSVSEYIRPIEEYGVLPVPWSKIENYREELSA